MQPRFAGDEEPRFIAVRLGGFPSGTQQVRQLAKPARMQERQRSHAELQTWAP